MCINLVGVGEWKRNQITPTYLIYHSNIGKHPFRCKEAEVVGKCVCEGGEDPEESGHIIAFTKDRFTLQLELGISVYVWQISFDVQLQIQSFTWRS